MLAAVLAAVSLALAGPTVVGHSALGRPIRAVAFAVTVILLGSFFETRHPEESLLRRTSPRLPQRRSVSFLTNPG